MNEPPIARHIFEVDLEDEMQRSYMDYAMSVIVSRALPDVRDGLKPVHRRVLYAMNDAGIVWNRPHRKSAKVVGEVVGNYHPHGDAAVYDTIVRMAQPFSLRRVLIDGQGNFGSVDGDAPAAMRYTEVRLTPFAHALLADLDKGTVDFAPNYDNSCEEPTVLPAAFPHLLVNGASGIAVGMATNMPPHNLSEIVAAATALIDDPELDSDQLLRHVPGPDFPTGGLINGTSGIREAYRTGRGRIRLRARTRFEQEGATERIVVTELPYQVNKARLLEVIAELVKNKRLTGIRGLRDESDKDGMRMVIELRRGEVAEVVLNNLYQHTRLESVYGINMVALDKGLPRLLNLRQVLEAFLRHRREVVTRRALHELHKARARVHILEGLAVALANVDEIVRLLRESRDPATARQALLQRAWEPGPVRALLAHAAADATRPEDVAADCGLGDDGYRLSETQAQAILDMRLQRLTGLEQEKILGEYKQLVAQIGDLLDILARPERVLGIIREELQDIGKRFGEPRRTRILQQEQDLRTEDLIAEEDVAVTFSHVGYAKSQPVSDYRAQRRGGKGRSATGVKQEDFIDQLFIASTHDVLLCFSSLGRVYWLKVYELPQAGPGARGKPLVNLLPLSKGERIGAVLPVREYAADRYLVMATADGTVKKVSLQAFSRPRASGIIAIGLVPGNRLVKVEMTDGDRELMLFGSGGRAVRFHENEIRATGRTSRGVRGIRLRQGERLISMLIVQPDTDVLTVTEKGYGKRTPFDQYPVAGHRGGLGVIAIRTGARNGKVVGALAVSPGDEIMLINKGGRLVRTPVKGISTQGRNTQGVRLIQLAKDELVAGLERIVEERNENGAGE